MTRKWIAIFLAVALLGTLTACGEEETTTVTGMIMAVDGSVISLAEGDMNFGGGNRPSGDFSAEDFAGQMPNGGSWGGQMPEDFTMPEGFNGQMPGGFDGQRPEGFERPENGQMPEDFTMPEGFDGQMPNFGGGGNGNFDFGDMTTDLETKDYNIANAHISVQIDGGKATGSMDDLTVGTSVTLTINSKGEVTNVLVTSSGFGGDFGGFGNFGGFGGFGGFGSRGEGTT